MPRSPVVKPPCVVERPGAERGRATDQSATSSEACSVVSAGPSKHRRTRRSRAPSLWAKAMDGIRELGAGAKEPPGARGAECSEGCPWNWRDPSRRRASKTTGRQTVVSDSIDTDNQRTCETVKGRAEVGGGHSSDDERDNITRPERRASSQVGEATSDDRGIACSAINPPALGGAVYELGATLGSPANAVGMAECG